MCDVLIVQRKRSCHVFCECGYVAQVLTAPEECPACKRAWDEPRFEEHDKAKS